jgi:hypothetical protein
MNATNTSPVETLVTTAIPAEEIGAGAGQWLSQTFSPPLRVVFEPVNRGLTAVDGERLALFSALALFILAVLWVWVGLKKEYVNLDRPGDSPWYDLRLWTLFAVLPYIVIYLAFGIGRGGG